MKIFLTGASGFIGGSVRARLAAAGHRVRGLVRDPAKAEAVRAIGVEPVLGTLDAAALLAHEARAADAVINAASSDHRDAIEALNSALAGSGSALVHTSGSSVVADEAMGEPSDRVFDEEAEFAPAPDKAARAALNRRVLKGGFQKSRARRPATKNTRVGGKLSPDGGTARVMAQGEAPVQRRRSAPVRSRQRGVA